MDALGMAEPQRTGYPVEHRGGYAPGVTALDLRVVDVADARKERDLLAAEARHSSNAPIAREPRSIRRDPRAPRREELPDLVRVGRRGRRRILVGTLRVTAGTPISHHFLDAPEVGSIVDEMSRGKNRPCRFRHDSGTPNGDLK